MDIKEELLAIKAGKYDEVSKDIAEKVLSLEEKEFLLNYVILKEKIKNVINDNVIKGLKMEITFSEYDNTFYLMEEIFYPEEMNLSKIDMSSYNKATGSLAYATDKLTTSHHNFFGSIKEEKIVIDLNDLNSVDVIDQVIINDKLRNILCKNILEITLSDKPSVSKKMKV